MKQEYRNTRFRCPRPPEPFPGTFAIITAYNPNGQDQPEDKNVAANRSLEEQIQKLGHAWFPVTGGSPDFSHVEPGFGIVTPSLEEALQIARDFDQEALFGVQQGEVILVSTSTNEQQKVGSWEALAEYYPRPGEELI